jgi:hypothetical protein
MTTESWILSESVNLIATNINPIFDINAVHMQRNSEKRGHGIWAGNITLPILQSGLQECTVQNAPFWMPSCCCNHIPICSREGGKKITLPHSHMYQSDSEKESNHTSIKSLSIQNRSQCFTIAKAGDRQRDKQTIQRQSFCHSKFINFQTLEKKPFGHKFVQQFRKWSFNPWEY